ncbi:MAG TPA: diaminopimelate epimerase [Actinomycetota bacterium]|nr:diaminopimelate epimerase [Actinomycetota bacterium]
MRFAKYQGIGNDFVMIADPDDELRLSPETVRALCDRRFGIGADGVIRVAPPGGDGDFFMDYVNSDGSLGEMCGNGIRCLAVFAAAEGLTDKDELRVETRAGLKTIWATAGGIRVDMGPPSFRPEDVPVLWQGDDALHAKVELADQVVEAACLSMGNAHAVLFVDDLASVPPADLGPRIETHPMFPARTNVEFVVVESPERIAMSVWERGSGQTLACGTGACAAAVASRVLRGVSDRMTVAMPGGELTVEWAGSLDDVRPVYMTGPAVKSFEGEVDPSSLGRPAEAALP